MNSKVNCIILECDFSGDDAYITWFHTEGQA